MATHGLLTSSGTYTAGAPHYLSQYPVSGLSLSDCNNLRVYSQFLFMPENFPALRFLRYG